MYSEAGFIMTEHAGSDTGNDVTAEQAAGFLMSSQVRSHSCPDRCSVHVRAEGDKITLINMSLKKYGVPHSKKYE